MQANNSVTNKINPFSKSLDLGNCPAMFDENQTPKRLGKYYLILSAPDVIKATASSDEGNVGGESGRRLDSIISKYVYPDPAGKSPTEMVINIDIARFESAKPLEANLEKLTSQETSKKEIGGYEAYFIEEEANGGWVLSIYTGIDDDNSRVIFTFAAEFTNKLTPEEAEALYTTFFEEVCS